MLIFKCKGSFDLMKIDGPGSSQKSGGTKKKDKVSSGSGSFGDMVTGKSAQAAPPTGPQTVAKVDALLAVQGAESPTERAARRRMHARADKILDELEQIRTGLLLGTLTIGDVIDVADVVAAHREKIMDPRLSAVLDEVDLRAQVEIAKLRASMDNRKP